MAVLKKQPPPGTQMRGRPGDNGADVIQTVFTRN